MWSDKLMITAVLAAVLFGSILVGCGRSSAETAVMPVLPAADTSTPTPAPRLTSTAKSELAEKPVVTLTPNTTVTAVSPTPTTSPTPFYTGNLWPACGQMLPAVPPVPAVEPITELTPDAAALAQVESMMPDAAREAWQHILASPETVGLVAFRVGDEANGVYLNADVPMPLASIVKIVYLVAYTEAVAAGDLDPLSYVPVADLDAFYQPGLDLGAHRRALAELEAQGLLLTNPDRMRLEDVPWMMIRFSSNTAMDYLHMLLGPERIEETAVSLGLTTQTAPCPFLAQFLAMSNISRQEQSDYETILAYLEDPKRYGQEAMYFADAFVNDADIRDAQNDWRRENRRPSISIQRFFTENLSPQASAGEYGNLMARLAQNGLSNPESSFLARRYLEWPMIFDDNQELFSNLGFKNGTMPGVLNIIYYAYPQGQTTPVVVVLFFHDLPNRTYRQWRNSLTHDEFARWLLYDEGAITAVANALNE
jgi:beta-lactamase class A